MNTLSYHTYFDKVYGCFLGKCIGGTAGGPAEGRKELLDYPLDESLLHKALPNDDLDLQLVWLRGGALFIRVLLIVYLPLSFHPRMIRTDEEKLSL